MLLKGRPERDAVSWENRINHLIPPKLSSYSERKAGTTIQTHLSNPSPRGSFSSPLRASWATWFRQATCSAVCTSPTEEPAEPGIRPHIQQAPHRLEEEEKGRITATRIGAQKNINGLLMGLQMRMKRCTFRRLHRVVGEFDMDRIHGEGGAGESVGDCNGLSKHNPGAGLSG